MLIEINFSLYYQMGKFICNVRKFSLDSQYNNRNNVRDRMFLEMQDFYFAPKSNNHFCLSFAQILPKSNQF